MGIKIRASHAPSNKTRTRRNTCVQYLQFKNKGIPRKQNYNCVNRINTKTGHFSWNCVRRTMLAVYPPHESALFYNSGIYGLAVQNFDVLRVSRCARLKFPMANVLQGKAHRRGTNRQVTKERAAQQSDSPSPFSFSSPSSWSCEEFTSLVLVATVECDRFR